jgi:hypothetical protein
MASDPITDELSSINDHLETANAALSAVYRRYGVPEGNVLMIAADDLEAFAAVVRMRSANAQLSAFLDRLPG